LVFSVDGKPILNYSTEAEPIQKIESIDKRQKCIFTKKSNLILEANAINTNCHRVYHGFRQAKLCYGGTVLSLNQF